MREKVLREGGAGVVRVLLDETLQDLFIGPPEVPGLGVRGTALFVRPFNRSSATIEVLQWLSKSPSVSST